MSIETVEGVEVDTRHWIGGRRVASADTFTDLSPIDEQPIAQVSAGSATEVQAAVSAAREAFPAWAGLARPARAQILRRIADGIDARAEELSRVETRDNGSLLRSHRRGVMPRVGLNFRFFADWLEKLDHPDGEIRGHRQKVSYHPAGVVAVITPWNAPLMLATWRIGPALAAGNTVVAKPPEWAPLTASLLADIAAEAGLPPGVLNIVQGSGIQAGAPLSADPRISRLSFTGSVPTAGVVAAAAAPNIVPLSFELGGKSPLVVFDDADLELAVSLAVEQFDNAGQVCLGAFRILVQDSIAERFTAAVIERSRTLVQGDPRDPATDVSCLISRAHFERVDGFVQRAVAAGAQAVLGGGPNAELGGLYYCPTVLVGAKPESEILTEEVFGPVLTVQTFGTEAEAIALANHTRFGLAATLVTGDPDRADRVSAQLDAGTVWVNCFFVRDLGAPFGGNGRSGIGREGGAYSFDFYSDIKNTVFAPTGWTSELPIEEDQILDAEKLRPSRDHARLPAPHRATVHDHGESGVHDG
jgi:5-carboxymethyl-2-hydroxymuconic-semialdehyde dehydrogenase